MKLSSFMAQLLTVSALLVLGAPLALSQSVPQTPPPRYNPSSEVTVRGTIESVNQYSGRRYTGTHIELNTNQGKFDVHLGPSWFFQQQNVQLEPGEHVQVTGSKREVNGRNVLIAREITENGQTAVLRNPQGFPLWSGRMGRQYGYGMHGMMGQGYRGMQRNCPGMQGYGQTQPGTGSGNQAQPEGENR